jgi:AAA domain-containing protein
MSNELKDLAQQLKNSNKKVQLIYAFNGSGKTRLSRAFKDLLQVDIEVDEAQNQSELAQKNVLYYNAFTEDLFYWDNDLVNDETRMLKIHPNAFTDWVFKEQGQDRNVVSHFQRYTNPKLTPHFNDEYTFANGSGEQETVSAFTEVKFSFERGNNESEPNIKISKGEESNFVWSVFYSLLEQVIDVLNVVEKEDRETDQFNQLKYVFIDDPVSSLDENHLMQLAVDLASLIKKSTSSIKFVVSTHDTTFYNFLHNELKSKSCFLLERLEDNTVTLVEKRGDSNTSFFYHLDLKRQLESAIEQGRVQIYHFTFLRNLYEKTASFLGYPRWSELLPGDSEENKKAYLNRIIQFSSHDTLANAQPPHLKPEEMQIVRFLLNHLVDNYSYWQEVKENA